MHVKAFLNTAIVLITLGMVAIFVLAGMEPNAAPDAVYLASLSAETTAGPTTTASPATVAPTTAVPTATVAPTRTAPPTTVPSTTTAAPTTTVAPTTTTVAPTTTVTSTTVAPTTMAPTTVPTTTTPPTTAPQRQCDPNYSGCVPIDSDVDCAGGSGNGPSYARGPVRVIGSDIYGLDRDNDGIGCE